VSGPAVIVVVFKTDDRDTGTRALEDARQKLESWSNDHPVELLPSDLRDVDAMRFAYVHVLDSAMTSVIRKLLADQSYVDAAYLKPSDETAETP
jgi:hypothetical protein